MYLSDRDLRYAIETKQLIIDPASEAYDTTSIDLHLDRVEQAKVWNVEAFQRSQQRSGNDTAFRVAKCQFRAFAAEFYKPVPEFSAGTDQKVYRQGADIILRPGGFFLWQTREKVGTPEKDPRLICFVDGKSSAARTGLLVHMTAPTIHAGWWGRVTLEIANLGPFDLRLAEGDAIAQIVVAAISSVPAQQKSQLGIAVGQRDVGGSAAEQP